MNFLLLGLWQKDGLDQGNNLVWIEEFFHEIELAISHLLQIQQV